MDPTSHIQNHLHDTFAPHTLRVHMSSLRYKTYMFSNTLAKEESSTCGIMLNKLPLLCHVYIIHAQKFPWCLGWTYISYMERILIYIHLCMVYTLQWKRFLIHHFYYCFNTKNAPRHSIYVICLLWQLIWFH